MRLRCAYESWKMLCQQAAYGGRQHCTSESNDCSIDVSFAVYDTLSCAFNSVTFKIKKKKLHMKVEVSLMSFLVKKLVTKSLKLSLFSCKPLSCLGASSHRTRFSIPLRYFSISIVFLCKQGRWMCLTVSCDSKSAALKLKRVQLILDTENVY